MKQIFFVTYLGFIAHGAQHPAGAGRSGRESVPTRSHGMGVADDDEKKAGIRKRYNPVWALYDEGECIDGKKVGEWRTYDLNGKVIKTTCHKRR